VDWIRFEYRATVRHDDEGTFTREWFFADPAAKFIDVPTAFGSSRFNVDRADVAGIGEVWERNPPLATGARNPKLVGDHYCGAPDLWRNGWPIGYGSGDVQKCCPLQTTVKMPVGGVLVGGASAVAHPVYEAAAGGVLVGGASSHRTARYRVYASGGILVGGWTPSSGGILVGGSSSHTIVVPVMAVTRVGLKLPALEFAVTGSPVVDVGDLTGAWLTQSSNEFFAGPVAPGSDIPAFRPLGNADVKSLQIPASNLIGPGKVPPELVPVVGNRVTRYDFDYQTQTIIAGGSPFVKLAPIPQGSCPVRIWAQTTQTWASTTVLNLHAALLAGLENDLYYYGGLGLNQDSEVTLQFNRLQDSQPVVESAGQAWLICVLDNTAHTQGATSVWVEWFDALNPDGGGSTPGPVPSDTVSDEQTFGVTKSPGSATTYSRGDHTHGTPAMPTAADVGADSAGAAAAAQAAAATYTDAKGSNSITTETTFGKVASPGTSALFSRGDHTHGTPALPTASQVGADPAGSAAAAQAAAKTYTDSQIAAGGGGGGQPLDPTLTALAGLAITPNSLTLGTGPDAFSQLAFAPSSFPARGSSGALTSFPVTDFALGFLTSIDAAAARGKLGLAGSYQPADPTLAALAALVISPNSLTLGTGPDAFTQTTFAANTFPAIGSAGPLAAKPVTDFALTFLTAPDAAAARGQLGVALSTARGYLDGLRLAPTSATTLAIAAGQCRDDGDTATWSATAITKILDPALGWALGDGQALLDVPGVTPISWYHVFSIFNPTTQKSDVIASSVFAGPTMPPGFTLRRRIGSFFADGSKDIRTFYTRPGGWFFWSSLTATDFTVSLAAGVSQLAPLWAPPGLSCLAIIQSAASATSPYWISCPDTTDDTVTSIGPVRLTFFAHQNGDGIQQACWTDTAARVRVRSNTAVTLRGTCIGWQDPRGRDN
jgi:hypothetical protein